jgi:hypothetical protein
MARGQSIEFAPVGPVVTNGYDIGGSRMYPISAALAITPPATYGSYIGSADGLPVAPPVAAQAGTTGVSGNSMAAKAISHPFGKDSPLPWVLIGLVGAVAATHIIHYK